jgi:hypothetical protein
MSDSCDAYEVLISGYLDGELDEASRRELESHIAGCSVCRRELDAMKRLVQGTSKALVFEDPPEEVWDIFLDNVYNRMERKAGWLIFSFGALAVAAFVIWEFFYEPWAIWPVKLLLAVPFVGMAILFISVLRQRLRIARNDRYSREINR